MTKYSSEFKIKIVKEYWTGTISMRSLCAKYSIRNHRQIQEWVSRADKHGLAALQVKRTKRNYTQDFKLDVVNYVVTNEVSRAATAAHYGISPSQVNSWYRIFQELGASGLRDKPRGRPSTMPKKRSRKDIEKLKPSAEEKYKEEILRLKAELHQSEMENDILKALATIRKARKKP